MLERDRAEVVVDSDFEKRVFGDGRYRLGGELKKSERWLLSISRRRIIHEKVARRAIRLFSVD